MRGALPTISVVSNPILGDLLDIVRFAKDIGFAVSLLPIELLDNEKDGANNWEARFTHALNGLTQDSASKFDFGLIEPMIRLFA